MGQRGLFSEIRSKVASASHVSIVLDYDGTLVPIVERPELAEPDDDLRSLLDRLADRRSAAVHVVSGRPRHVLENWLAHLPVALWAEHGAYYRAPSRADWVRQVAIEEEPLHRARVPLIALVTMTPGSFLEEKSATLAWHYRMADPPVGPARARALTSRLADQLRGEPVEVLEGKKLIEVRYRGVTKAVVADHLVRSLPSDGLILACGDDRTDEDLFAAVPDTSITIAVGDARRGVARYLLRDYRAVRELLLMLSRMPEQRSLHEK